MLYFFEPNVFFISFISGILSAAGSPTATLLRLHPSQRLYRYSASLFHLSYFIFLFKAIS